MKNRQNPRTKSILILTFSLLLFRVAFGDAADNIQLRKYPSQDAIVLGTVTRDHEIKIIEEYGPWYYIVVEGTTYGGGWVYARDLKPEPIQAPPSHGKVSMSTVKIHSSTHPGSPKKNPGATIISNKLIPDKKKQEKPSVQAENIAVKRDLNIAGRETAPGNTKETQTNPEPETTSSRTKEQQIHEQAIASTFTERSKRDMFHTAAPRVTVSRESRDKKDPAYKGGFRTLLDFGFKLLSVALSCLAIIFSYQAKKMATLSYQVAIQFQRDFEIRQEKESDGLY